MEWRSLLAHIGVVINGLRENTAAGADRAQALSGRRARLAAGLAAAAALVGALLSGLLFLLGAFDEEGSPTAASTTIEASVAFAAPAAGGLSQITVLDSSTGARRPIGPPDSYTALEWSPDGSTIAALAPYSGSEGTARVHLLSLATGDDTAVTLPPGSDALFLSWAPDSSRVAVVGIHLYLVGRNGSVLSEAVAPSPQEDQGTTQTGGGYAWSPDSHYFGAIVNGALILMERDGAVGTPALSQAIPSTHVSHPGFMGWTSGSSFVLGDFAAQTEGTLYEVVVKLPGLEARQLPPGTAPPVPRRAILALDGSVLREVESLVPGGLASPDKRSADGSADVFVVRPGPGAGQTSGSTVATIVVRDRDSGAALAVPGVTGDTRGGSLLDVFVHPARGAAP